MADVDGRRDGARCGDVPPGGVPAPIGHNLGASRMRRRTLWASQGGQHEPPREFRSETSRSPKCRRRLGDGWSDRAAAIRARRGRRRACSRQTNSSTACARSLAALEPDKRKAASFGWNGPEWRGWNYFGVAGYVEPGGSRLEQMNAAQKEAAWQGLCGGVVAGRHRQRRRHAAAGHSGRERQRRRPAFLTAVFAGRCSAPRLRPAPGASAAKAIISRNGSRCATAAWYRSPRFRFRRCRTASIRHARRAEHAQGRGGLGTQAARRSHAAPAGRARVGDATL